MSVRTSAFRACAPVAFIKLAGTIASTRPRMANTTINSSSVKPAAGCRTLPVDNILVLVLPARLAVGPQTEEIVLAMLTRRDVLIILAPGILRDLVLGQVRSIPPRRIGRFCHQCLQSLRGRRKALIVETIEIQRVGKAGDLELCGLGLRAAEVTQHAWSNQSSQQTQNDQDDQQLHQREAG